MNILHVVRVADDPSRRDACDAQAVVCAAAIRSGRDARHRVLIIGPAGAERRAASLGLTCHGRIAPVLGRCGGSARGIARVARAWDATDIVQTYGLDTVAASAFSQARRVLLADCLGDLGAAPGHGGLPPRLGPGTFDPPARGRVRTALGIGEDEIMVLALGDPADQVEGHALGETVAMLNVAGIAASAVAPRGARGLDRARRHAVEGYLRRLIVTDEPVWNLLRGADIGVVALATPRPTLSTRLLARHAIDLGVPVVTPQGPAWEHLGGAALLASENRGSRLAGACFRWLEMNRPAPAPADSREQTIAERIVEMWGSGVAARDAA